MKSELSASGVLEKEYARECQNCGKPVPSYRRLFCCALCSKRYHDREYKRVMRKGGQTKRFCIVCGVEIGNHRTKFCSNRCKSRYYNKEKAPRSVTCVMCGKVFLTKRYTKTCGPECSANLQRQSINRILRERRKIKPEKKTEKSIQVCLRCDKPFVSEGNRICPICSKINEHLVSGVDYHYYVQPSMAIGL